MKYKAFDPHKFIKENSYSTVNEEVSIPVVEANKLADEIMKLRNALYDLSQENKKATNAINEFNMAIEKLKKVDGKE